jgi:tetratricopeptide (TPR) repeat protein/transcriptional regulator with XRE-family HTH domain
LEKHVRGARTRLIEERKRRKWSQQDLADRLGTTQNNISRWELGITRPSPYFRTKICDLFRKDAHDLDLLQMKASEDGSLSQQQDENILSESLPGEYSPGITAPESARTWFVPYRRNPWFTGQEAVLAQLARELPQAAEPLALCGMGGIGKTQIALEYVYRHALEYSAVFWIGAETVESIISSLLHIAEVLQLPEQEDKDQQRVVAAVQRWLSAHGRWLLIWDNVEDLSLLDRFLPTTRSGAILLTTRYQALGTLALGLNLLPMEPEEGVLFLLRRAKVLHPEATGEQMHQLASRLPAKYAAAEELVTVLGGLPLALDQAGAYVEETQCGLSAYLDLFHTQRAALLQKRGEGAHDHPASVFTTLMMALEATTGRHPAVLDLLRVCALLQPDAIPEELFRAAGMHLGATLAMACRGPLEWDRVVGVACSYSLLSRQSEEQTLSIHRLVQMVLRECFNDREQIVWLGRIIEALNTVLPEVSFAAESVKQGRRFFPHILAATNAIPDQAGGQALLGVLRKAANYLSSVSPKDEQAEALYQRALRIGERMLEPWHAELAAVLQGLASLYRSQRKYEQAEESFQRALYIRERIVGPEHPLTADLLHHLASLYWVQRKYEQAEPLYQRALGIREQTLGPEHPDCALSFTGLASLYGMQGKYEQAEPLFQHAFTLLKGVFGPEHPRVAMALHNLAEFNLLQGKYEQAEPFFQQALSIWERDLGPENPDVSYPLISLADLYTKWGRGKQAEPLYQRALHITEHAWGAEHPLVAERLNGLANLYAQQGKQKQAELLYEKALRIQEQQLDYSDPETAQTQYNLALCLKAQGRLKEASILTERALSIHSRVLGETHPKTISTQSLYAHLLQEQACARGEVTAERHPEEIPDSPGKEL